MAQSHIQSDERYYTYYLGCSIGSLGAGALTNLNAGGWRNIFWIQAVFHGATSLGLFLFYWPPKTQQYAEGRVRDYIWACDPIGSAIFVCGATILLLGLNWAGGSYAWSDPHVAVPLALGLALFIAFAGYGMFALSMMMMMMKTLLTAWQNGEGARTASWRTYSSAAMRISHCPSSPSLSRDGSITALSTPSFHRWFSTWALRRTRGK